MATTNPESENEIKIKNCELIHRNKSLNTKFEQLKSNIIDLKSHLDNAVFNQLESKDQKITDIKSQINEANNKISSLSKECEDIETYQNAQRTIRGKYFSLLSAKVKNENFYLNQEEIISDLSSKSKALKMKLQNSKQESEKKINEYNYYFGSFSEKKATIEKLQTELSNKIADNKNSINILNEKNKEISELRNILESLKAENENQYQNIQRLKSQLAIAKEKNKHIKSFINENSSMNINVNNTSVNNLESGKDVSRLNENEENNMKQIEGLMKSILEE